MVLADVDPLLAIAREDLFGPLLSLIPVADDDEALRFSRLCPYSLGASVFGEARDARRLASRIDAGMVTVNDVVAPIADPRLPLAPAAGADSESPAGLKDSST